MTEPGRRARWRGSRLPDALLCAAACLGLAAVAPGPGAGLYPLDWLRAPTVFILGPLLVLLALIGPRHAWVWGVAGLVVGGLTGHWLGDRIYAGQLGRLERAIDPDLSLMPHHPGWWIALLVIAAFTVAGILAHRRLEERQPGHI